MTRILTCLLALASLAGAQEYETLVLEMPNTKADELVKQVKEQAATPWRTLVNDQGSPLEGAGAKLVARLKADVNQSARAEVQEKISDTRTRHYAYRVSKNKDGKVTDRSVAIFLKPAGDEKAMWLEMWSFGLAATPGKEWTFSGRHRQKETSRVILERCSTAEAEPAKHHWYSLRLTEGKSTVGKRGAKLAGKEFPANPDEFYRVDWCYPEGQWYLVQEDTVRPQRSVVDASQSTLSLGEGIRITFGTRATGVNADIDLRKDFDFKGKKASYVGVGWPYERGERGQEPPFTIQKALEEQKIVFEGGSGSSMGQNSRKSTITGEVIAH